VFFDLENESVFGRERLVWTNEWAEFHMNMSHVLVSRITIRKFGTVSWVLSHELGAHRPLSPMIKLGIRHPRKKARKKVNVLRSVS